MGSRQLNVAGDVVGGGSIHTAHTLRTAIDQAVGGGHQLHLAEQTARGGQGLAHVLEHGATRGLQQGGEVAGDGVGVHGDSRGGIRVVVLVEGGRGGTSGDSTDGDVITSVQGDLLQTGLQGGHLYTLAGEKKLHRKRNVPTERAEDGSYESSPSHVCIS